MVVLCCLYVLKCKTHLIKMRNPPYILFRGVTHVIIVVCNYPLSAYMHELQFIFVVA